MIAQYYSKNCVRLTTSSPASPKQEAPKRGRSKSGGGDVCRVRRTTPSPPSQEWHGVASGEACGVYVRVCGGVWGAERDYCSST